METGETPKESNHWKQLLKDPSRTADFMGKLGPFLTGLAAILAAVYAIPSAVHSISNAVTSSSSAKADSLASAKVAVFIDTCKAEKQVKEIIEDSKQPDKIDTIFDNIPENLPTSPSAPLGLVIAPEFRRAAKARLADAPSVEAKKEIINGYWERSLSKETKSEVNVRAYKGE
jgi:hypothetical protein